MKRDQFDCDGFYLAKGLLADDPILAELRTAYASLFESMFTALNRLMPEVLTPSELPQSGRLEASLTRLLGVGGQVVTDHLYPVLSCHEDEYRFRPDLPVAQLRQLFELCCRPAILDCVATVIGPELLSLLPGHLQIKLPEHLQAESVHIRNRTQSPFPIRNDRIWKQHFANPAWHTPLSFGRANLRSSRLIMAWIALTPSDKSSGGLRVIKGSHRYYARNTPGPDEFRNAVHVPVEAGDVIFLHGKTFMTSAHNTSHDRFAWSVGCQYLPIGEVSPTPAIPAFVVRSQAHPAAVYTDPDKLQRIYRSALMQLTARKLPRRSRRARIEDAVGIVGKYKEFALEPEKWLVDTSRPPNMQRRDWRYWIPRALLPRRRSTM